MRGMIRARPPPGARPNGAPYRIWRASVSEVMEGLGQGLLRCEILMPGPRVRGTARAPLWRPSRLERRPYRTGRQVARLQISWLALLSFSDAATPIHIFRSTGCMRQLACCGRSASGPAGALGESTGACEPGPAQDQGEALATPAKVFSFRFVPNHSARATIESR
jgi:hypothetical protein